MPLHRTLKIGIWSNYIIRVLGTSHHGQSLWSQVEGVRGVVLMSYAQSLWSQVEGVRGVVLMSYAQSLWSQVEGVRGVVLMSYAQSLWSHNEGEGSGPNELCSVSLVSQ